MHWVGKFPMADKIPRTLKGFCKSTHEKLKFFTTWDNNSSPKKNQNNSSYLNSIVVYLSCFQVPWRAFQDPKNYLHRKDRNSRDWGKKKKQQINWELNVGKHASFFEPRKEITPVVLFVHGHSQELSSDCISLQPRGSFSTNFQQRRQSQK